MASRGRTFFAAALTSLAITSIARAKTHTDTLAGVSFEVPFDKPTIHSGTQVEASIGAIPAGITYTSGVSQGQKPPFLRLWMKSAEGQMTQEMVSMLAEKDGAFVFKLLGIKGFRLDKKTLRGDGSLPPIGGVKTKIVMQLVRDQYSYIGFFYTKDADLKFYEKMKKTIKVLPSLKVELKKLPKGGGVLGGAKKGAIIGAIVGALACVFYWVMKRQGGSGGGSGSSYKMAA